MPKINLNAWREIIARVFEGFDVEPNVTPDWLVNPATKRKLKLDLLYPQISTAIRFEGLKASGLRSRLSLEEDSAERQRTEAREAVCLEHGISLAILNLSTAELVSVFQSLETAMSRATRMLAKDETLSMEEKTGMLEKLSRARGRASQLRREIKTDRDLDLYSSLWHDRLFKMEETHSIEESVAPAPSLAVGIMVEHSHFGSGKVVAVTPSGDDDLVTIDFFDAGERTFMAGLLGDKITVQ